MKNAFKKLYRILLAIVCFSIETPIQVNGGNIIERLKQAINESQNLESTYAEVNPLASVNKSNQVLAGIPNFDTQIDITVQVRMIAPTGAILPPPPLAVGDSLPAFIFTPADYQNKFAGGLAVGNARIPAGFVYAGCFIAPEINLPALFVAGTTFPNGALCIVYAHYTLGVLDYYGVVQIECGNVGYGLFLNSLLSDSFQIVWLRMSVPSLVSLTQLSQQIYFYRQSMYGRSELDSINPQSQKSPMQNQVNIIDLAISQSIEKYRGMQFGVDGTQVLSMNLFIRKKV